MLICWFFRRKNGRRDIWSVPSWCEHALPGTCQLSRELLRKALRRSPWIQTCHTVDNETKQQCKTNWRTVQAQKWSNQAQPPSNKTKNICHWEHFSTPKMSTCQVRVSKSLANIHLLNPTVLTMLFHVALWWIHTLFCETPCNHIPGPKPWPRRGPNCETDLDRYNAPKVCQSLCQNMSRMLPIALTHECEDTTTYINKRTSVTTTFMSEHVRIKTCPNIPVHMPRCMSKHISMLINCQILAGRCRAH